MADAPEADRIELATSLLVQAPPGELADVLNDVRVLFDNDEELQEALTPALAKYNKDQHTLVAVPWTDAKVILCDAAEIDEGRFIDPIGKKAFAIDHVDLSVSAEDDLPEDDHEADREALQTGLNAYLKSHYPNGTGAVYARDDGFHIVLVDSKYNPDNFWTGRWRSAWTWNADEGHLTGVVRILVHYYEDGNVQLATEQPFDVTLPADTDAAGVVKAIRKAEGHYHEALNAKYAEMNESAFRLLRRALPLTKAKVDWNKIAKYKIGSELAGKHEP
ncbi:hypothetical protein AMAG_09449 [Allomyces macrogynus ATCC 38327]|uniref:F-actin-capping protein subunit alpha n=1 Tax=Allomyces macrogynus (strain ATCC 38327) TaxID=578462 RepID=A0A0L0SPL7_ALLM3|nr:hypothetical protein AMAG_09449 [Allomyces macrogynus ATCC 38327]|eukprot:KNE64427.1 hypothetical protein AMAG_09449 [Allomyces macrogynus ATCC 38327]